MRPTPVTLPLAMSLALLTGCSSAPDNPHDESDEVMLADLAELNPLLGVWKVASQSLEGPETAGTSTAVRGTMRVYPTLAGQFVEAAAVYESEITVRRADQRETVDGKSIMQMMMLAATKGTDLQITADGGDADDACAELERLVSSKFQED